MEIQDRYLNPKKDETTASQLSKINEMFEEFKLNTITKSEFVAGIGDKADKEEIANIVSYILSESEIYFNSFFRSNEKNMIVVSVVSTIV